MLTFLLWISIHRPQAISNKKWPDCFLWGKLSGGGVFERMFRCDGFSLHFKFPCVIRGNRLSASPSACEQTDEHGLTHRHTWTYKYKLSLKGGKFCDKVVLLTLIPLLYVFMHFYHLRIVLLWSGCQIKTHMLMIVRSCLKSFILKLKFQITFSTFDILVLGLGLALVKINCRTFCFWNGKILV